MRLGNGELIAIGAMLLASTPLSAHATTASASRHHTVVHNSFSHVSHISEAHGSAVRHSLHHHYSHVAYHHTSTALTHLTHSRFHHVRVARYTYHGVQCVTFAKADTGIDLHGNAKDWWENAAGIYQRGARPEVGAVLNFRANPRMHYGHVAVVASVIDARTVTIDQANWVHSSARHGGPVTRGTTVVDVSPNNDWTAVRVGLNSEGSYGSIYPTYGFIYDRPDNGTMVANNTLAAAPATTANAAPSDLRHGATDVEVAETPQVTGIDPDATLDGDAPDRGIQ